MDSQVLQNMDHLFGDDYEDKTLLWTGDYNMASKRDHIPPVQGGFLVIKPSFKVFQEMRDIVQEGDFRPGAGWKSSGIGHFWGGPTIQGLLPYYYAKVRPEEGFELNHCTYNNMADSPYRRDSKVCRHPSPDGNCEDCRKTPVSDIVSSHFTICQKPWRCQPLHDNSPRGTSCLAMHAAWFNLRRRLEKEILGSYPSSRYDFGLGRDRYACTKIGQGGYIPLPL
eukprot:UC4_evm1s224